MLADPAPAKNPPRGPRGSPGKPTGSRPGATRNTLASAQDPGGSPADPAGDPCEIRGGTRRGPALLMRVDDGARAETHQYVGQRVTKVQV